VKLTLVSENEIRLEPTSGPLIIEAATDEQNFSPFHMMAGGLAYCAFSVMYTWAETVGLSADDLSLDLSWTFADNPHRVDRYDLRFDWPSLPGDRLAAAKRVVQMCTIHATLHHPPTITVEATTERETDDSLEHAQADGVETTR
jgi:uncharacterized OsmC-like protein